MTQAPLFLVLLLFRAAADDFKEVEKALQGAERARDPAAFAECAQRVLKDGSARAVRAVLDSYGRFCEARPSLPPDVHYRLHSELAQELGKAASAPEVDEIIRQREKAKTWESRLLALDASSFRPEPLQLWKGAVAALRDRPVVARRALEYLKNDRRLVTVEAVVGRYLEVDLPRGQKGEEWDRLRYAFRSALTALLNLTLPAAVDYKGYVESRRENPADLFEKPPPARGLTELTIFGTAVTGNNIIFIIDVSGSMMTVDPVELKPEPGKTITSVKSKAREAEIMEERRRITRAKKELSKVVSGLPEGKRINIIAYSSDVQPWKRLLTPVNAGSRKEALEFIAALKADGITVTDEALESAFGDLAADTIYLITDGAPTHVGSQGSALPVDAPAIIEAIHRRVRELNYFRGARVFTLGFPEAEESFLKKLSADNAGVYTPVR